MLRRSVTSALVAALALACTLPAAAEPAFDPRDYQREVAGQRTEVLVIGTPHLSGAPAGFDPAVLEPLLARLQAFAPDVIAIENLSGESLTVARAYEGIYQDTAKDYGGRAFRLAAMARETTGLELPAAEAEARRVLAAWPEAPSPAERRRLAALLAAAGDPNSAVVQWWRLPPSERIAGDGVSAALAAALDEYDARRNESHLIGARLAVRLGRERLYPIDDQSAVDLVYARMDDFMAYFGSPEVKARVQDPAFQRLVTAVERTRTPDETLAMFRELNSDTAGQLDAQVQWKFLLDRPAPDVARRRLAEWETRNLRMVANIREAAAEAPGGRVLVIVGAGHKPWFDAYLGMMSDMKVVDAAEILR